MTVAYYFVSLQFWGCPFALRFASPRLVVSDARPLSSGHPPPDDLSRSASADEGGETRLHDTRRAAAIRSSGGGEGGEDTTTQDYAAREQRRRRRRRRRGGGEEWHTEVHEPEHEGNIADRISTGAGSCYIVGK